MEKILELLDERSRARFNMIKEGIDTLLIDREVQILKEAVFKMFNALEISVMVQSGHVDHDRLVYMSAVLDVDVDRFYSIINRGRDILENMKNNKESNDEN